MLTACTASGPQLLLVDDSPVNLDLLNHHLREQTISASRHQMAFTRGNSWEQRAGAIFCG